ncbi:MAG TPA: heme o synthase, partial [Candidatus Polarisedimenticolia bacterium]|nr:heme o synthase [Candidatus Polarisedimenticolia bacterium]
PALPLAAAADYLALTKPRVVLLILVVTLVGFVLGTPAGLAGLDLALLAPALLGTALVAAGTLALNQYLERDLDSLMQRTRHRPLPGGRMHPVQALAFGVALVMAGLACLSVAVNPVSGMVTAATVATYLFCYTPMKRRSALCTVIGAFPGALPPVTGYAAASGGSLDIGAAALFGILFFWQLPHSLAIAQLYRQDYDRAGVRLLPTVDADGGSTQRQIVANCVTLLAAGMLPAIAGLTGWVSFVVAGAMGLWMLGRGLSLALGRHPQAARRLLMASYVYLPVVLLALALDKTAP